ncbi:MAG: HEPN domain-containing protein [Coriobacteriia bacterium]|nr:HEPN domain-containing protein [Desulfobacteraceae bacterium]
MKPETTEWVQKAEGDMNTAQREFAVQEEPNHDAVCFHAQQCAEKYLKAKLIEEGLPVMRTHDLEILLDQLLPFEAGLADLLQAVRILSAMAVEVRYPGMAADEDDAAEALRSSEKIRNAIRSSLNL